MERLFDTREHDWSKKLPTSKTVEIKDICLRHENAYSQIENKYPKFNNLTYVNKNYSVPKNVWHNLGQFGGGGGGGGGVWERGVFKFPEPLIRHLRLFHRTPSLATLGEIHDIVDKLLRTHTMDKERQH